MSVPGFLPEIGDAFGQRTGGVMAPGLAFAFGMTGDSFIDKAIDNKWLLMADDIATPATTNKTVDLQLRATLEPIRDLKIDLNASRTETKSRSIQYMYANQPTTQSGPRPEDRPQCLAHGDEVAQHPVYVCQPAHHAIGYLQYDHHLHLFVAGEDG